MVKHLTKKLLLHCCCAACASYAYGELEKDGWQIIFYFDNPNLDQLEYRNLLSGIEGLALNKGAEVIEAGFNRAEYLELIGPYCDPKSIKHITDPERLERKKRELLTNLIMQKTADRAKVHRIKAFSSSMLCSPYRDHNNIWDVGVKDASERGLEFVYRDLRKGYWTGRNYAKNNGLAIPVYCSDFME